MATTSVRVIRELKLKIILKSVIRRAFIRNERACESEKYTTVAATTTNGFGSIIERDDALSTSRFVFYARPRLIIKYGARYFPYLISNTVRFLRYRRVRACRFIFQRFFFLSRANRIGLNAFKSPTDVPIDYENVTDFGKTIVRHVPCCAT